MTTWLPMFALANVEVKRAIEVDGFALASIHDERVQALARAHHNFHDFLNRFTTEFGQPVTPSVLICRDDTPVTYRSVDAVAAFRDAIAMAIIPQSWAKVLRYGSTMGIKYSDYFAVYPWMLDKNFEHLIASPPRSSCCRRCRAGMPLEQGERPVVGIKHHLLRLARIGPHEQHAAVTQPDMGGLHSHRRTPLANDSWLQILWADG